MEQPRKAYIYKLESPSGKVYIGRTRNLSRRLKAYEKHRCITQRKLFASLTKHGYENHTVSILFDGFVSDADLFKLEQELIAEHDCVSNGLNILAGGSGFSGASLRRDFYVKEETRRRISVANKGKKRNEDFVAWVTENNPMKNSEHKAKMIDSVRLAYTDPELRQRLSEKQKQIQAEYNPRAKRVFQYTIDGALVAEYKSTHDAAKQNGTTSARVSAACLGQRKTHLGHVWKY